MIPGTPEKNPVQFPGRGQIGSERLLNHDAGILGAAGLAELFHHHAEKHGWDGQVMGRTPGVAHRLLDRRKGGGIIVVAVDIPKQSGEFFEGSGIEPAVLLEAVLGSGLQLIQIPACLGHADDRHVEVAAFQHRLQRGENLLVGKVARRSEKDERVRLFALHGLVGYRDYLAVFRAVFFAGRRRVVLAAGHAGGCS